jgi:hypothetical protein
MKRLRARPNVTIANASLDTRLRLGNNLAATLKARMLAGINRFPSQPQAWQRKTEDENLLLRCVLQA